MKKQVWLVAFVLIALLSSSFTLEVKAKQQWKTYQSRDLGFSIKYPEDWSKEETENANLFLVMFAGPKTPLGGHINVNLVVESLLKSMKADEYGKAAIETLRQILPDFKLLKSSHTPLGGSPAYKAEYSFSNQGVKFKAMQVYTLKNNRAYVITYTST